MMRDVIGAEANDNMEIKRLNDNKPKTEDPAEEREETTEVEESVPEAEQREEAAEVKESVPEAEVSAQAAADGETDQAADVGEPTAEPEGQIADLKDQLLRALADSENMRRRAQREKEDTAKYAIANFARDVLAVSDNLARALDAVPEETRTGDETVATLIQGLELTQREFQTAMERHGIRQVEPLGERFDHNFHQAMYEVESDEAEPGIVVQVAQPGYVIGERLLRPAMVGVAKKPAAGQTGDEAASGQPASASSEAGDQPQSDSGSHIDTKA